MAVSDAARRHHAELFPDHVSTLAQTDPELVEYFDNFAFDDVLADSDLDVRTRLMVQLAALIAARAVGWFRVMAGAALTVGVTTGSTPCTRVRPPTSSTCSATCRPTASATT